MRFNLKSMSFDDLLQLRDNVARTISRKAKSEKRELQAKLAVLDDLTGARGGKRRGRPPGSGKTGRKVAPKYRNPKNRSETWSGRGRMPLWLQGMVKQGRKREEFAIGKNAAARAKAPAKRGRRHRKVRKAR